MNNRQIDGCSTLAELAELECRKVRLYNTITIYHHDAENGCLIPFVQAKNYSTHKLISFIINHVEFNSPKCCRCQKKKKIEEKVFSFLRLLLRVFSSSTASLISSNTRIVCSIAYTHLLFNQAKPEH